MSASDWYARRLAPQPQQQQQPSRVNPNHPGRPQQQQPQYPQQYQQPVYQPQPQQQYQQPQQAVEFAGYRYENAQQYQGGIAQKLNPDLCPSCGGNQYFAKVRTKGRGPEPAGHCYNCFAGTEEYLTVEGNKTFADTVGTTQTVFNHEGKWVEAEIREFGVQTLQRVTFRPGLRRSNLRHSVLVTADHRWLTARGEVTDLTVGDDVAFNSPGVHQVLRDEHAWVRGFGFGDGTVDSRGQSRVRLCGDKARYEEIFALGGGFARYEEDGDPLLVFDKGQMVGWKELPDYADEEALGAWLWGYIAADGEDKDGYWRLSSQDSKAVEFVKRIAPYAGLMVTGHNIESNTETNFGPRSAALHRLTLRPEGVFRVVSIETVEEDTVFCAVVDDGHSFTLANGIVTGNCGYNELFDQGDSASWGGGNQVITAGDVELASIQVTASPWSGGLAPSE